MADGGQSPRSVARHSWSVGCGMARHDRSRSHGRICRTAVPARSSLLRMVAFRYCSAVVPRGSCGSPSTAAARLVDAACWASRAPRPERQPHKTRRWSGRFACYPRDRSCCVRQCGMIALGATPCGTPAVVVAWSLRRCVYWSHGRPARQSSWRRAGRPRTATGSSRLTGGGWSDAATAGTGG